MPEKAWPLSYRNAAPSSWVDSRREDGKGEGGHGGDGITTKTQNTVQVTEEFVEAVDRGQELVFVAKMILAELPGFVAVLFKRGSDRASLCGQSYRGPGVAVTRDRP
jgi:hypothetical protein